MNGLTGAIFPILLAVVAAIVMLWLVLRPLKRTVRSSGPLWLLWIVVSILLSLLGLVGLGGGGKKLLP